MDGPTVTKVADYGDAQTVDAASTGMEFLANRVEVEQCLGRMFVGTVPAVDHRHPGRRCELRHGSLLGVSHDNHIAVAGQDARGVVQRLALGERRRLDLGGLADITAKQIEGGAEGHPGPSARLEEHVGQDRTLQNPGDAFPPCEGSKLIGGIEKTVDVAAFKLLDGENVAADEIQGFLARIRTPWKRHFSATLATRGTGMIRLTRSHGAFLAWPRT